jgi:hypothetical protein
MDRAKELAEAHWGYIKSLLMASSHYREEFVDVICFYYKTAMIHGYGHGAENERNGAA